MARSGGGRYRQVGLDQPGISIGHALVRDFHHFDEVVTTLRRGVAAWPGSAAVAGANRRNAAAIAAASNDNVLRMMRFFLEMGK